MAEQMNYTIYKASGQEVHLKAEELDLETMQKAVEGYIELVNLHNGFFMVVNEEGHLLGLPINEKATGIYQYATGGNDAIVGNAIVAPESMID